MDIGGRSAIKIAGLKTRGPAPPEYETPQDHGGKVHRRIATTVDARARQPRPNNVRSLREEKRNRRWSKHAVGYRVAHLVARCSLSCAPRRRDKRRERHYLRLYRKKRKKENAAFRCVNVALKARLPYLEHGNGGHGAWAQVYTGTGRKTKTDCCKYTVSNRGANRDVGFGSRFFLLSKSTSAVAGVEKTTVGLSYKTSATVLVWWGTFRPSRSTNERQILHARAS